MERGRRRRVDLITELLERLSDEDLGALERAVGALANALEPGNT
jgi:hypothetical protein